MKEPSNTWEDPIQLVITLFTTIIIEVTFYLKYIIFPDYMLTYQANAANCKLSVHKLQFKHVVYTIFNGFMKVMGMDARNF